MEDILLQEPNPTRQDIPLLGYTWGGVGWGIEMQVLDSLCSRTAILRTHAVGNMVSSPVQDAEPLYNKDTFDCDRATVNDSLVQCAEPLYI